MSEVASIQMLSARHTLLDGTLRRLGQLRLIVIIWLFVIRTSCIKAQRKKTVRAAAGTQLRQGFPIVPRAYPCVCPLPLPRAGLKARCPDEEQHIPFASLRCDGSSRSRALRNYPHIVVLLPCALRTTPSNSAVIAR
jgi:hypothetical protein